MSDTFDVAGSDLHTEQLQADDTLIDRGVPDVLDEGYTVPERWSPLMSYGATPAEQRQGETLERRMLQDEPEQQPAADGDWRHGEFGRQVGSARAGRLVDARSGNAGEVVASDVGIDGGAAGAEEAAMHVFDPERDNDDDDQEPAWQPKGAQ